MSTIALFSLQSPNIYLSLFSLVIQLLETLVVSNMAPNKYNLTASQRVPPIARPFVSERALKTLDIVCILFTTYSFSLLYMDTNTRSNRSRSSLMKNAFPQTPCLLNSSVQQLRSAFLLTLQLSRISSSKPRSWDYGTCSCPETTSRRVLDSPTWSMG